MEATLSAIIIKKVIRGNIIRRSNIKVMSDLSTIEKQVFGYVSNLATKSRKQIRKFNVNLIYR